MVWLGLEFGYFLKESLSVQERLFNLIYHLLSSSRLSSSLPRFSKVDVVPDPPIVTISISPVFWSLYIRCFGLI
jgi:hypothetical protein